MTPKQRAFWIGTSLVILLDQLTKIAVRAWLTEGVDEVPIIPGFLAFIHAENPGAAFSMMATDPNRYIVFGIITVIVTVVLAVMVRRLEASDARTAWPLGVVWGGVLGNAIDRALYGSVTDFVLVYAEHPPLRSWLIDTVGMADWPAFNVADAALWVGLIGFLPLLVPSEPDDGLSEQASS